MARRKKPLPLVADVCFYGNQRVGYGWLAKIKKCRTLLGTGEPNDTRALTDCLFEAVIAIRGAGVSSGRVEVFDPSGLRVAEIEDIAGSIPYFGDLIWHDAPVYVIPAEAIIEAAEKGGE